MFFSTFVCESAGCSSILNSDWHWLFSVSKSVWLLIGREAQSRLGTTPVHETFMVAAVDGKEKQAINVMVVRTIERIIGTFVCVLFDMPSMVPCGALCKINSYKCSFRNPPRFGGSF